MGTFKQLIANLRYLASVDMRQRERVADEVRDFLKRKGAKIDRGDLKRNVYHERNK